MAQEMQSQCSVTTWREDGERDERGIQEEGDTCLPWPIHVNVWQKKKITMKLMFFKKRTQTP